MEFNQVEKLGMIKAIDEVINVDDRIYEGESFFLSQLSKVIDFDRELFDEARQMRLVDAIEALKDMPEDKKEAVARILKQAASADGKVDDAELRTIHRIFREAGLDL